MVPQVLEPSGEGMSFLVMSENFAIFESSFPNDERLDEAGELIAPAGRNITAAIADAIESATEPSQHSFYGWRFEFDADERHRAWALLQSPGPWLLIVEAKTGWLEGRKAKKQVLGKAVEALRSAILTVPELSGVEWMSEFEFQNRSRK